MQVKWEEKNFNRLNFLLWNSLNCKLIIHYFWKYNVSHHCNGFFRFSIQTYVVCGIKYVYDVCSSTVSFQLIAVMLMWCYYHKWVRRVNAWLLESGWKRWRCKIHSAQHMMLCMLNEANGSSCKSSAHMMSYNSICCSVHLHTIHPTFCASHHNYFSF